MSIFDFYDDDDENANGTIELRSSITTNDEDKKENKSNRRLTLTIENKIPSDALCKECSNQGTSQTMTDCDKCKIFYHFACCVPPSSSFPKRRNYGWTCHRCNDDSEHENEIVPTKNSKRERKNPNRSSEKEVLIEDKCLYLIIIIVMCCVELFFVKY